MSELAARQWLTAGPHMSALDRLEIYRRGYHARLLECLADDYPTLREALGANAFESLGHSYIARYPSHGPNLNFFGRRMASFIRREMRPRLPLRAFAADLASLEWAIVEVIHASSEPPLAFAALGDIPMEAWPNVRLAANTALRLLQFAYPVNAYFRDVRGGQIPPIPDRTPSATVVFRSGPTLWRMDLTAPMFEVLSSLIAGNRLSDALALAERGLAHLPDSEASASVQGWFAEWVRSGLFAKAHW